MKHFKTRILMTAAGLALAASLALAAPGEEAEGTICQRAFTNCLADLADGPFSAWNLLFKFSYCLSGNEFCKKYVEPFL
jgi:hypothetical protein